MCPSESQTEINKIMLQNKIFAQCAPPNPKNMQKSDPQTWENYILFFWTGGHSFAMFFLRIGAKILGLGGSRGGFWGLQPWNSKFWATKISRIFPTWSMQRQFGKKTVRSWIQKTTFFCLATGCPNLQQLSLQNWPRMHFVRCSVREAIFFDRFYVFLCAHTKNTLNLLAISWFFAKFNIL